MSSIFLSKLKDTFNVTTTENGAKTYKSSKNAIVDLFGIGGASRNLSAEKKRRLVFDALEEDAVLATKVILYLGDIREGQGERDLFRIGIREVLKRLPAEKVLELIPEYSLWKIVIELFDELDEAKKLVAKSIALGNDNLLYKWLPSLRTHKKDNALAYRIARYLGVSPKEYRALLKDGRSKLNLVETNLSTKNYSAIDYNAVPSKAGLKYRNAFYKHDNERYTAHVTTSLQQAKDVKSGKISAKDVTAKVNVKALYPHEIVNKYTGPRNVNPRCEVRPELDAMWESLPDYTDGVDSSTLVIGDVSGSMHLPISKSTSVTALNVSTAMSVYFAEKLRGPFKNHFIVFSQNPVLNKLSGDTLYDKLNSIGREHPYNTNLQRVFDLILETATLNNLSQRDMPQNLLIISDMEFDEASGLKNKETNLQVAREKYSQAGYELPTIVFWNVHARNVQVPATVDDDGVVLVSGYSPITIKFILTGEVKSPLQLVVDTVSTPRYSVVDSLLT